MGVDTLVLIAAGSVVGGLVGLVLVVVAWRNRDVPAATAFGWLNLAISGWCFFAAAQLLAGSPTEAFLFERLVRVVGVNVPPLGLTFALSYAGHDGWLTPKTLGVLWVYPVAFAILSVTAPWHGLASTPAGVTLQAHGGIAAYVVPAGPAEQAQIVLSYVVLALAFVVLFRIMVRTRAVHRNQAAVIALGMFLPVATNAAYHVGFTSHPGIDLTPVTFVLSGGVVAWGLFRYDFLAVAPLANGVLVDELPDPVLVLDEHDTVIDNNPAATEALGADELTGSDVSSVAPGLTDALHRSDPYSLPDDRETDGGAMQFYDPQVATLDDHHGRERGRLVVLREVTGQQRRQDRLEALQTATQRFITAPTSEQIAQLAVDFVERALDRHAAAVLPVDDETRELGPAAMTDYVRDYFDEDELVFDAGSPVFDVYEDQEATTFEVPDSETPFRRHYLVPIGEHGILSIGARHEEAFASEDEQFATILARTTQVALTQVERESELRQHRASLEHRNEQIEFFNGVLRHTLRNALLVIQGRADHLNEHLDADGERHLDVIVQWCDDLASLSDEIRAINDTVTATESKRLEVVDLSSVLYDRARAAEDRFDDATVSLDVDDDLQIQANELADRVLEDVVTNAVEHNDGDDPHVDITTRRAADRVQVYVADDGPGLSDEMKSTVFDRDLSTNQTANGFGLYFVSVIMNLYGGTVWFEDNEPRGTVAVLEFQAAE